MFVIAYHLTFTTYGTWLHGDERFSYDKHDGLLVPDPLLWQRRFRQLKQAPIILSDATRDAVDAAIREVCVFRQWRLLALNVRTNHVHIAVNAHAPAAKMLHDFKAYATRRLRNDGLIGDARVGTAKGGVKEILHPAAIAVVVDYILNRQ